jgi:hypothetical protein
MLDKLFDLFLVVALVAFVVNLIMGAFRWAN